MLYKKPLKLPGLHVKEAEALVPDNLLFLGYRGSIAHGMYVPNKDPNSVDDKDLIGMYLGPINHYLGFGGQEVYERQQDPWDVVCYELRKLFSLLLKGNPNVLSILWLQPKHVVASTPVYEHLCANSELFVSTRVYHSFKGYAYSQFHRMEHAATEGYMGAKRKALVEKYGYNTKNAAHLIRLLRMCVEFLKEGRLYVDRGEVGDAGDLLAIKQGKYKLEQVKQQAEYLFALCDEGYSKSQLPPDPQYQAIETLLVEILQECIKCQVI